ncbi:hypothetical protein Tco_1266882 [Tanacetum coccineum]
MMTLQFANTHNLVVFLTKSAKSEGFEQILDFLNASSIKYALTINPTIYTSCIEQFWSTVKAKMVYGEVQLQALVDGKKIVVTEASIKRDLQLEDADDEAVTEEPSMQLKELTDFCTKLQQRVLDLENTKTAQAQVGRSARVVSSEEASLGDQEDTSKQGRKIDDIDANEDILKNVHDAKMFDVNDLDGDEVVVESEVADKDEKGDVIKEPSVPVSAASKFLYNNQHDNGKGKMVEEEPVKKMSKKELLKLDEELAFKLQAKEDKEERLTREKAQRVEEDNIAWDDIQAKVEADYQLA